MLRRLLVSILLGVAGITAAVAQNARPFSTSAVGPWEAVVWTRDKTVTRCTLARAQRLPDGTGYGFLVDHEVLFGIDHRQFAFKPNAKLQLLLTPAGNTVRKLSANAVTPTRANILLPKTMLDELQKAEYLDVEIAGHKIRLPFDDFNAARVVLESCVQKIGKNAR